MGRFFAGTLFSRKAECARRYQVLDLRGFTHSAAASCTVAPENQHPLHMTRSTSSSTSVKVGAEPPPSPLPSRAYVEGRRQRKGSLASRDEETPRKDARRFAESRALA